MNGKGVLHCPCLTRRAWRAAQVVLIVLALIAAPWPAQPPAQAGDAPAAAPGPGQTPLAELLDQEGRLDLASGFRGSIDARGWQLVSGPNEAPAFAPLAAEEGRQWSDIFHPPGMNGERLRPGGGRRRQPLRRGRVHQRRWRGGEPHRQVGRQRLVCPGQRDGWNDELRRPCPGGGRRRQSLRRGRLHHRRRRGGEPHRQVGRQHLVCPGQRDERRGLCAGGGRRRQPLRRGRLHHRWRRGGEQHRQVGRQRLVRPGQRDGYDTASMPWRWTAPATSTPGASSPPPAAWRRTISPSGTAAPGLPGQRDEWLPSSMPWRWTAPATSTPGAASPPPAAWRRTISPSGTAAPGLPWAAA